MVTSPFVQLSIGGFHALALLLSGVGNASGQIAINEIVASNRSGAQDEAEQFDDWIELRNLSSDPVDLGGMYLTDTLANPTRWRIPNDTMLAGQSYLLIWTDGHAGQSANHASFSLQRSGGTIALMDRDASTVVDKVDYAEQSANISYGRPLVIEDGGFVFYPTPTPGQPNITTSVPLLAKIEPSKPGGFFRESLEISLTTPLEGGEIRYTLDGEQPTSESMLYEGGITIDETASVTAAVYAGSRRVGPVASEVYLAVGDDLADFSSNLPVVVVESRGYRFSRDSSLNRDFPPQLVYSVIKEPGATGRVTLQGTTDYAGRAGMNVRGASSREWPKKSYKFETWDAQDGNNDVALLGLPQDCDWILHGPYFDKTFMRNHLTYLWWKRLGHFSVRTRFVELFLNQDSDPTVEMEDYVGVYVLMEKIKAGPDRVDVTELQPFDIEEPAISGGYVLQTTNIQQHFTTRRGVFMKYVSPRQEELATKQKTWIRNYINDMETVVFKRDLDELADPLEGYSKWIDLPSHIDYDIMRELTRNIDGASTYMSLDRGGKLKMGPLWDYNQSLGMTSLFSGEFGWRTVGWNNVYMRQGGHWAKWWDKLDADPDYQTGWNDRWVELRRGILNTDALTGDIDAAVILLEEAQQRNYERWNVLGKSVWITGSPREAPGYKDRDTYAKEVAWMREWLVERLNWIDAQVPAPPEFHPGPGSVADGTQLQISPGTDFKPMAGALYYTVDGTDPRLPGGEFNPNAIPYTEPIALTGSSTILARIRSDDGDWSALGFADYLVGARAPSGGDLVISEIHYNPLESQKLEFVEITNASRSILDLSGVSISDAFQFSFELAGLEPRASIVIVEDEAAFRAHYGESIAVAGAWAGQLANGGESLTLRSPGDRVIATVTYDDAAPWPVEADGLGSSLERLSFDAHGNDPLAWRASNAPGGTPGSFGISYTTWAATQFSDQDPSGPDDDADEDGATNFLEFALGSNPIAASSVPRLTVRRENDALRVTYRQRLGASIIYQCEISIGFKTWEPPAGGCTEIGVVSAGSDATSQLEDVTIQVDAGAATDTQYLRISVSE
jgi:hypothetical protein